MRPVRRWARKTVWQEYRLHKNGVWGDNVIKGSWCTFKNLDFIEDLTDFCWKTLPVHLWIDGRNDTLRCELLSNHYSQLIFPNNSMCFLDFCPQNGQSIFFCWWTSWQTFYLKLPIFGFSIIYCSKIII